MSHQLVTTPADPRAHDSHNRRKWDYENGLYQQVLGRYLTAVYRLVAGATDVLDVGCGEGFVYRALRSRGYDGRWRGVDASEGAVNYARHASPECDWAVEDIFALAAPSRTHELVLCSQVLEHVPHPERALAELARVSRRWLVVSVPYEPVFRAVCALTIAARVGRDPGHVNFWTPGAFRDFLKPAGRLVRWVRSSVYQIALVDTEVVH